MTSFRGKCIDSTAARLSFPSSKHHGVTQAAHSNMAATNLYAECLDVVRTVRSPREIGQIELYLIPAIVESHWHCANERLHSGGTLIVAGPESSPNVLVVKHLSEKTTQVGIVIHPLVTAGQFNRSFKYLTAARKQL